MKKNTINKIFNKRHKNDKEQLDFIFSNSSRILVEAPAGYGKTKTMVSKIAYLLANNKIPNPKKILALTFSINASYKIKKDVTEQLPIILQSISIKDFNINDKIFVSNYHGFCRHILKLYGYLLHKNFFNINIFESIDDNDIQTLTSLNIGINLDTAQFLSRFCDEVKAVNYNYIKANFNQYNELVIKYLIPNNFIPYNAILTLTINLFQICPKILLFYKKYFPIIIIDEFQDTNMLSYDIIKKLIDKESKLFLMGDSLQRIYGFIGAIENLLDKSQMKFNMDKIILKNNYRFKNNKRMLLLDKNIRKNAENLINPDINETVSINFNIKNSQNEEAFYIAELTNKIFKKNSSNKIAILVRSGYTNSNTKEILNVFDELKINYFFALFSDEDSDYINFHKKCLNIFNDLFKNFGKISKKLCNLILKRANEFFHNELNSQQSPLINSLFNLLKIFFIRLFTDYSFLSNEDKLIFIKETLENNSLKQSMEFINSNIIISTIHGAKGLEWDWVILSDLEQNSIPSWFGLCGGCSYQRNCNINFNNINESKFLEELSVFYVGVTRAKKGIYFTASKSGLTRNNSYQSRNISCLLKLKGISLF